MKLSFLVALCSVVFNATVFAADWPMSNDSRFDTSVENPMYEHSKGPIILLDAAHHNFHVTVMMTAEAGAHSPDRTSLINTPVKNFPLHAL